MNTWHIVKWHLISSNSFSRVYMCDRRADGFWEHVTNGTNPNISAIASITDTFNNATQTKLISTTIKTNCKK